METTAERLLHCHIKIKQMEMHKMHDNTLIMFVVLCGSLSKETFISH